MRLFRDTCWSEACPRLCRSRRTHDFSKSTRQRTSSDCKADISNMAAATDRITRIFDTWWASFPRRRSSHHIAGKERDPRLRGAFFWLSTLHHHAFQFHDPAWASIAGPFDGQCSPPTPLSPLSPWPTRTTGSTYTDILRRIESTRACSRRRRRKLSDHGHRLYSRSDATTRRPYGDRLPHCRTV